jgi:glutamate racemase
MMIGLFDSGWGGLSIARAVRAELPTHHLLYLADSAYCPYGPRPIDAIRARARACGRWLVEQGATLVVVACNTATAAAIELLRSELPVPVVGTEPGVKPAVAATRTGKVAVLATSGTLASERLALLVQRFGTTVMINTVACPELVTLVERGELDGAHAQATVAHYIDPLRADGVDTFVLGCTHFPFLAPLIVQAAGSGCTIIDTGPAVARRVAQLASAQGIATARDTFQCATTGDPAQLGTIMRHIWGSDVALQQANC